MVNKLYICCGVPGSGKTTFLNKIKAPNEVVISRDDIRWSLLKPGDDYFSKDDRVYPIFIDKIGQALKKHNVYADATHLTQNSRDWLVYSLMKKYPKLQFHKNFICFRVSLEECLVRNEKRNNTRAYVPPFALEKMYKSYSLPDPLLEDFEEYYFVDKDGNVSKWG